MPEIATIDKNGKLKYHGFVPEGKMERKLEILSKEYPGALFIKGDRLCIWKSTEETMGQLKETRKESILQKKDSEMMKLRRETRKGARKNKKKERNNRLR